MKAIPRLILTLVLGLGLASPPHAQANAGRAPVPPGPLASLAAQAGPAFRVGYHRATGRVSFLGSDAAHAWQPAANPGPAAAGTDAASVAGGFLAEYGGLLGLAGTPGELAVLREKPLPDGRTLVRYQQQHQGVPVLGGEVIVQVAAEARGVVSVGGEALPDLQVNVTPAIPSASAGQLAVEAVAKETGLAPEALAASDPSLWLYHPALLQPVPGPFAPGLTRLVWRLEVTAPSRLSLRQLVLVDAQRGSIALSFNQVHSALTRRTYHGQNNSSSADDVLYCGPGDGCTFDDADATSAHLLAGDTYNLYQSLHGRDSIDNAGRALTSTVHYREDAAAAWDNAAWTGERMIYGDRFGFARADDVVGHELTHGVTQFESNLFYYYQAGAINEALSDLWGEAVDQLNGRGNDSAAVRWLMGEDVTGYGVFRSMQRPPDYNDPDRIQSPLYYTGTKDFGGVHTNSGVSNKAAYLMADGGTFNGFSIGALGLTTTLQIYYEAATNLLTSGSDYLDLYNALGQACLNLFGAGHANCAAVEAATLAVEMNAEPYTGYNPEAPICPAGQSPTDLFFDGFEAGAGQWTLGPHWQLDTPPGYGGPYAANGQHSLFADDYPDDPTDTVAALVPALPVPPGAYLRFAQAFGFEDVNGTFYDGGVLEYSLNGGQSWFDAGPLFDANGYNATLAPNNPLGARAAFGGDSHGYISSRLNLASLAGSSVRFRFRLGLDEGGFDWGWWIDDVRIYTCGSAGAPYKTYLPGVARAASTIPPPAAGWQAIVSENFEGAWPGPWLVFDNEPAGGEQYWAPSACRAASGSQSAWAVGGNSGLGCGAHYPADNEAWMDYGPFGLAGATAARLEALLWLSTQDASDHACLLASADGRAYSGTCWWGQSGRWENVALDLANTGAQGSLLGDGSVWVALVFKSDGAGSLAEGAFVDDVALQLCPDGATCAGVAGTRPAGIRALPAALVRPGP